MRKIMAVCLWLASMPALAQAIDDPDAVVPPAETTAGVGDIVDLQAVTVSAAAGPGLWKVSRNGHVLWILGTISPLPRRMQWQTREVEALLARAQEVILAPEMEISPKLGVFSKLALVPAAMGARRNPGGASLREVVPAAEYARWQALKARHLGGDRGVEMYRPIFAAGTLYREAIDDAGLTYKNPVHATVARLAGRHGVRVTEPKARIRIVQPKVALRAFKRQAIDDRACFSRTLDRIEGGLGTMHALADAWSIGDLATLRALPSTSAQYEACAGALSEAAVARELGLGDLRARKEAAWLAAVEKSLSANRVTIALMPVPDLLTSQGVVAALRARGYAVEDPDSRPRLATASAAVP